MFEEGELNTNCNFLSMNPESIPSIWIVYSSSKIKMFCVLSVISLFTAK